MGEESKIPHIAITINDIQTGACEILAHIRPNWTREDVEFKLLTDGITNKLVGCRHKDVDVAETVLVRVYGNKTDLLIDRKAETRNILLLSKLSLAPQLYATFANGLAYEFVPGCTLTTTTVKHRHIYPLVASKMAQLHKVPVSSPQPFIWDKLQKFLDLVPENFTDACKNERFIELGFSKVRLQSEIDFLKRVLADGQVPVVFCHNDLLLGNVIYTEEKNCVTFIDYEYAACNYQAYDIANHFLEFAGVENVDYSKYPSRDFQLEWLRVYLEEFQTSFTDGDVEKLYQQVGKFVLVSHLFWGIWALIQTEHSYIEFDFLGYAEIRFKEYFAKKDELIAS